MNLMFLSLQIKMLKPHFPIVLEFGDGSFGRELCLGEFMKAGPTLELASL